MSLINETSYKAKINSYKVSEIHEELKSILDSRQAISITRHGFHEAYLIPAEVMDELIREYGDDLS